MIQYGIVVLFCVLCFRPWSDTVRYCCFVCCVSGHGVIQYGIVVLFCVLCSRPWSDTVQYCCIVLCAVF